MLLELASSEFFAAHLALDLNFSTSSFDVLSQLGPGQLLELLLVADVTTVFVAFVELSMLLKLSHCLPTDLPVCLLVAFVRELAEVNAISYYRVNVDKDFSFRLAIGAGCLMRFEEGLDSKI